MGTNLVENVLWHICIILFPTEAWGCSVRFASWISPWGVKSQKKCNKSQSPGLLVSPTLVTKALRSK